MHENEYVENLCRRIAQSGLPAAMGRSGMANRCSAQAFQIPSASKRREFAATLALL